MPKAYSYQNLPVFYRVTILNKEIPRDIIEIDSIDQSLDYPQLNVYRISEATITFKDDQFNPNKSPNFFTNLTPPHNQSGYKVPVKIEAGFIDTTGQERKETLLNGIIINTNVNARNGHIVATISDNSQEMRTEPIKDFGLEKIIRLRPGAASGSTGVYPIPNAVLPVSDESYSAVTSDGTTMVKKDNLDTEGILSPTNFTIEQGELQTEGGNLDSGEPVLTFKAPYRDKSIKFLVEKILQNYDITIDETQRNLIDIPNVTEQTNYYTTLGRPSYDTENEDRETYWFWDGFVTDFIVYRNKLYFLLSGGRANTSRSRIIKYNLETEESETLYTATAYQEWWKLIGVDSNSDNDYNIFYILGTEPQTTRDNRIDYTGITTLGFYNSSIPNPGTGLVYTRIWRIIPDNTLGNDQIVWVPSSSNLRPQLAVHYTIGASYRDHKSGDVPESRVGFAISGSRLYYRWANETGFGVASIAVSNAGDATAGTPRAELTANRDVDGYNSAGHDFTIDGNTLYAAFNWINDSDSRLKIVSKNIS